MDSIKQLIFNHPNLEKLENDVRTAARIITDCFKSGGKLLLCGNGGSCADCEHISGELVKQFAMDRPLESDIVAKLGPKLSAELHGGLPALSLPSMIGFHTAFNNDDNPEFGFAQQVIAFGKPEDILWGISTSGNSKNVINAVKTAKALGLHTIGLTGEDGGTLSKIANTAIHAPAENVASIQELHLPIYHAICAFVEDQIFS